MFKWLEGRKKKINAKKEMKKVNRYYQEVKRGALFIKFVQISLEKEMKETMNRHQRRQFQKQLKNGMITQQMVMYYASKIDQILAYIDANMNRKKPKKASWVKRLFKKKNVAIDGAKLYAKAKEAKKEVVKDVTDESKKEKVTSEKST